MKIPNSDAAIMPPNTGVPTAWRVMAPAPLGNDQRQQSEDERETGHHHRAKPQARRFNGGSLMSFPSCRCSTANATIRMPFFAASAISTTSPICA